MKALAQLAAIAFAFAAEAATTSQVALPRNLEPRYAEAVLAFNGRDYDQALKVLDELLKQAPDSSQILELKALTLKGAKKTTESADVYRALIDSKTAEGAPAEQVAPYHFELGVMAYRDGKDDEARAHLEKAAEAGFNEGASNFFLGMIHFKAARYGDAGVGFEEVVSSEADDLKPAAHFYLGQVHAKTGYAAGAIQSFSQARDRAEDAARDEETSPEARKIAQSIQSASERALAPLDRSQAFGSLSVLTAVDSNVLARPETDTSAAGTNKGSVKTMLQAGVGYMTSPLSTFQLVPSLRTSANYNFNRETRDGEFVSFIGSLYVTRKPIDPFSYGLKLEGGYLLQNRSDGAGGGSYTGFSKELAFGPYFRSEVGKQSVLGGDVTARKRSYDDDAPDGSTLRRSGVYWSPRIFWQRDRGLTFFNPTVSLRMEFDEPEGDSFQAKGPPGINLSNLFYLSEKVRLSASVDIIEKHFQETSGTTDGDNRQDTRLNPKIGLTYRLSPKVTLLGELAYLSNKSNVSTFDYRQTVLSAGASYTLF